MHLRAGMHGYGPRPNIYGRWGHRYEAQGARPPCENRDITAVLGLTRLGLHGLNMHRDEGCKCSVCSAQWACSHSEVPLK